jgi:hypothetical protein
VMDRHMLISIPKSEFQPLPAAGTVKP